jgi:hypothetical protein
MAEPLATGSICEVRIYTRYLEQTCLNVLHYRLTTATVADYGPAMEGLRDSMIIAGSIVDRLAAVMSPDAEVYRVDAQPVSAVRLRSRSANPSTSGTLAGVNLPPNVALVLTKNTDVAARWGQGSMHIPGITVAASAGGVATPAALAAMGLLGTEVRAVRAVGLSVFEPVLWNSVIPARATRINQTVAQTTSRVMRRRTVGVGI